MNTHHHLFPYHKKHEHICQTLSNNNHFVPKEDFPLLICMMFGYWWMDESKEQKIVRAIIKCTFCKLYKGRKKINWLCKNHYSMLLKSVSKLYGEFLRFNNSRLSIVMTIHFKVKVVKYLVHNPNWWIWVCQRAISRVIGQWHNLEFVITKTHPFFVFHKLFPLFQVTSQSTLDITVSFTKV